MRRSSGMACGRYTSSNARCLRVCTPAPWRRHAAVAIYLCGGAEDFFADPLLMLHEYCHVLLQWQPRRLTSAKYLLEWLRRGYWDNRFEIEAREFAQTNLYRFRALLSRHP